MNFIGPIPFVCFHACVVYCQASDIGQVQLVNEFTFNPQYSLDTEALRADRRYELPKFHSIILF